MTYELETWKYGNKKIAVNSDFEYWKEIDNMVSRGLVIENIEPITPEYTDIRHWYNVYYKYRI